MLIPFLILFTAAPQADAGTPAAPAAPVATPEKKVCRPMMVTGSVLPKRLCLTKPEWTKMAASTDAAWESARAKRGFITKDRSSGFD